MLKTKRAAPNEHHEDEVPLLQVRSRMWDAVISDDLNLAKYLLENGVDPRAKERGQTTTALMEAHILGRTEIVRLFLSNSGEKLTPPSNTLVKGCKEVSLVLAILFFADIYFLYFLMRKDKTHTTGNICTLYGK
ncbi:uncharacterized protein LOC119597753 [Penaeus monodon]|uniref:uncharacterized protein LOC119597753 n=1 Tax=Penaeus monodon TaxID=6687 RepID=UPI0018A6D762|nr:uncharacterized protein LOC119597753 [Penaeus monodon]